MDSNRMNKVPNSDFSIGEYGGLPDQWVPFSSYPALMPVFQLVDKEGKKALQVNGNGSDSCVGWIASRFTLEAGKTYRMWVRFRISDGIDPQQNLVFSFWEKSATGNFNDGVFRFKRLDGNEAEGEGQFLVPCSGEMTGEIRIVYKLNPNAKVWIYEIGFAESEPIPQRNVRVACAQGQKEGDLEFWGRVL